MSISSLNSSINSLLGDIATLQKADADEAKREADALTKANSAREGASRSSSSSTVSSKLKEHERAMLDAAKASAKRADLGKKLAEKHKNLSRYREQLSREEEAERKKIAEASKKAQTERERNDRKAADEQKKLIRERAEAERRLTAEIRQRANISSIASEASDNSVDLKEHDFFISHASEDKAEFVQALAESLRGRGAVVWYDDFSLKVGDSLRRSIDKGLASSKFGVVVLSEAFFKKEWPARELDGLVAKEVAGTARILPIWHKVSKDEVTRYSPTLADKLALNSATKTVSEIVDDLMDLLTA